MSNSEQEILERAARAAMYEKGDLEARDIVMLLGHFLVHMDDSEGARQSQRKLETAMPKTMAVMREWLTSC